MTFLKLFDGRRSDFSDPALGLYRAAVAAARAPGFYARLGVPDTPDGRFDMIAIYVFLVLRRLRREQGPTRKNAQTLGQELTDLMFADMDRNLRELGVGDLGVGRQVKALAAAFRGRIAAYDAALDQPDGDRALASALKRNIFRRDAGASETSSTRIARHIRNADTTLTAQSWAALAEGTVVFPPLPGPTN